ncbi:MAG: chemotaxis response regulator protein-glutamate methylesterase [Pseudomonadota bacterium]
MHKTPIRVVVVDDSALMRRMLQASLEREGDIEVVGLAADTVEGRQLIRTHNPDVITLDVEMPGMNGIAFLEKIMELRPTPVIMVSSLTARGTETALEALAIGAVDALAKPAGADGLAAWGPILRRAVHGAAGATVRRRAAAPPKRAPAAPAAAPKPAAATSRRVVAIGASTGGVGALSDMFRELSVGLTPIVITQHMPPGYTARFANRLAAETGLDIAEARDGEPLGAGAVRIAPGDRHLELVRSGAGLATRLGGTTPVSGHCPSVDTLFFSAATAAGNQALGIILTGMGRDGAEGLLAMHRAGATCLGQVADSCVVYGMPKAARALGAVSRELSLAALAGSIRDHSRARLAVGPTA